VRRLRQLLRKGGARRAEQVVVVEGAELLSVALAAGADVEAVYVAPEGADAPAVAEVTGRVLDGGGRVFDLAPGVMERVASTVTPQPLLAVVSYAPAPWASVDGASLVVVCVDVRDPGNLGTVIRTADAAGADAVVCCDGTVDPTNPKTVRATAGSLFHVPVVAGGTTSSALGELGARGFTTVATVVRGGTDYEAFDWGRPVALVLGNEATGLDEGLADAVDDRITIPMAGRSESLNVGVSAAVLCFEAGRQRRGATSPEDTPPRSTMSAMETTAAPEPGTTGPDGPVGEPGAPS
jgi:TrmH family RNA methyltransferase